MVLTNYLGVVFTATALSANNATVTLAYPEDGATNTLAWAKLSVPSQEAVCRELAFAPVPPELASTYRLAERELRRVDALLADKRIVPELAATRRESIRSAFAKKCRAGGVSEIRIRLLLSRLR